MTIEDANADGFNTDYGFTWGPMKVTRVSQQKQRIIEIETKTERLTIYVSPTGRKVRVFRGSEELK